MKKALTAIIAILCMAGISVTAQSSMEKWTELNNFHKVMAQTFHPMEDGDYKPIKERSGELAEKARLLADSKIPAEFSKPEMVKAVQELNAGCRNLDAMIKNKATDQEISKLLSSLHDTFHKIVGLCQPGHDEEKEKHNDSDQNHKH